MKACVRYATCSLLSGLPEATSSKVTPSSGCGYVFSAMPRTSFHFIISGSIVVTSTECDGGDMHHWKGKICQLNIFDIGFYFFR